MNTSPKNQELINEKIVGDVIAFLPNETIEVKWGSSQANMGNTLKPTQMKDQPSVKWSADPKSFYTLIMTDPDAPSRAEPTYREWNHWLVVNIPGDKLSEGEVRSEYVGAGPPEGTGLHRYVLLVLKQRAKGSFADIPTLKNNSGKLRGGFNTKAFIQKYTLKLEGANFVQAEWDDYVPTLYKQLGA